MTPSVDLRSWADGQVARARGDKQKALAAFAAARKRLDATWQIRFKDQPYFALASSRRLMPGLAEKRTRSARHVERSISCRLPRTRYWGPGHSRQPGAGLRVDRRARPRARATRNCRDDPVASAAATYGDLKFNPCWDDLRGDPRFDKIVASLAPKSGEIVRIIACLAEQPGVRLEIGHVLFIDIVGYSKLLITEQTRD